MQKLLAFLAAVLAVHCEPCHGEPQPAAGGTMTVTATRAAVSLDQTVAPVVIIDRAEIERSQATDIATILQFHAGIEIARNGGPGQPVSVFLRGANSNETLVLLDGVRINPGVIGGAALQNIRPEDIERIEIIKGPRSALYGSDAIGGVINIITRKGASGLGYATSAGGGTFATQSQAARIDYGRTGNAIGIAAANYHTNGFPTRTGSDIDRGYDNRTVNFYAAKTWGNASAEFRHWQTRGVSEYLDFSGGPLDEDFANEVSALELRAAPTGDWNSQVTVSHVLDEILQNQSADFEKTHRDAVDWLNRIMVDSHQQLAVGAYGSNTRVESLVFGSGFADVNHTSALYAEDSVDWKDHRLVAAVRRTYDQTFGSHWTWNLNYGYRFGETTRMTLDIGTGFRAPSGSDRFGFGGNPDLAAETSRDVELGLHRRVGERQRLTVALFENRISNLIVFVADPTGFNGQNQNVASARIRGIDASYELTGERWSWRSEAVIQRPLDERSGDPLPRRARRSLTSGLFWRSGHWKLGLDMLATSSRKDSNFSNINDAGYVLAGLSAGYRIARRWTLAGRIENLFDISYQTAAGFNSPGRSIFVRLRYSTE